MTRWKKPVYTQTREYYSALKKEKILTQDTTWKNLDAIKLSEIKETQKDKHYMIPLT